MALAYLKVFFDFEERAEALSESEQGRLLLGMLKYARTGAVPAFKGNERFLWPMFKASIDREQESYEAKVENGRKGGRPLKPQNRAEAFPKPDFTPENHPEPDETKKEEKEEKREKKEERRKKNTPSFEGEGEGDGFQAFWAQYPRKQNKQEARQVWEKLKPAPPLQAEILTAIAAQRQSDQWVKEGGRYIPLPSTWLHNRRWEDEAFTPPPPNPVKRVSAQNYGQRDYTEDELLAVSEDLLAEARRNRLLEAQGC